jgi:uncharacterized protein (TIRG00374 family)
MSDQSVAPGKPSLAARIDQEKSHPLAWKTVASRAAMAVLAGLAIYLVFPAITEVLASWPRLSTLNPWWLFAAIGAEIAHFACTFALQRLALRTRAWFPVITSQLAGNAITLIMPGGAAVGAAVQFRMLAVSGMDTSSTVGGLAAFSLLGVGGLLALPLFALPVILIGAPVDRGLEHAAFLGAAGFVAFAAFGAVILVYDAPLRWAGRAAQWLRNVVVRKRPPLHGLDATLLEKRDEIRTTLGRQWWQALLLSAGRLAFDYLCLLLALRATGSHPRPSLILVAYAVAGIIGMIPLTPGGLGLVEASLTGLLVLAEVDSSQAVLATLTYRIASYWVPLCAGPVAYGLFKFRYRNRKKPEAGLRREAAAAGAGDAAPFGIHGPSAARGDPGRGDQHGDPPLLGHHPVVGAEVVVRPARGGEDLAQQQAQPLGVDPGHRVVGSGQLHRPFDPGPLPARADHHGGPRPGPQVSHPVRVTTADQADDLGPGHGMREHTRVHYRRLDRAVRPQRGHHAQTVIAVDQPGEVLESAHG